MAGRRTNVTGQSNGQDTSASSKGGNGNPPGSSAPQRGRFSRASSSVSNLSNGFDPRLIFSQIAALQCFHYVILGVIFQCNHVLFGSSITLDRIFTAKFLDIWSMPGWIDNGAVLVSSVTCALLLAIIVEKSKKCLDFSVTLFLIHVMACTVYGGIPSTWDWWIVHVLGVIIMILLGEFFCSRRELSDIPLLAI